ncbi:hypothetical protein ACFOWM_07495 [Ferruginibacter yonginensis]|uniref:Uncharacterized protein n=1 Tax=Ferruginibacter yonginensis TaxID=1310416 RepID=A0ABV8QR36_9BACT
MLTKITITITVLFTAILIYLANAYHVIETYKLAFAKDFVPYYQSAAQTFFQVGLTICIVSWLWVNFVSITSQKLFWLWIPFVFSIIVAIGLGYCNEHLFHFKKEHGLWKGEFSLSYFFSAAIIIIAAFILITNYWALKLYFKTTEHNTKKY